ncbi:MAG TPA: ERF family protein [Candidatus Paceibacterota bacterium]
MEKSESIKELATAMSKAQAKIEGALRDSANPFFKSKYADLSSVVDAIKSPLGVNGLSYTQVMHDAENAVAVETIIMHSSGEWISCGKLSVPVVKADAQGYGSALTYARRYSLSAAFGVAPEDDDGNAAAKAKPTIGKVNLSPEQIAKVDAVASKMVDWLNSGSPADAVLELENAALDADEKTYCWTWFDSKQRSAMKIEHAKLMAKK